MSLKMKINNLSQENALKIKEELVVKIEGNKHAKGAPIKYIFPYLITSKLVYLPFSYAVIQLEIPRRSREEFTQTNLNFCGELRDEQKIVKKEAMATLSKTGSILLNLNTGFGKTLLSINLTISIKMKTLIIVNKLVLIKQWEESILKVCPTANVQKLTTKSVYDESCHFYIVNAINVYKFSPNFFKDIGICIVDELHLIMAESLSKALQHIEPRYLIGLSATAYRLDGLDPLIELYFGKNRIIRELNREHKVYCVYTGFSPIIETTEAGSLNWNSLLKQQSENEERNELIIDITQKFKSNTFLILTKRIKQGKLLVEKLTELGEHVSSLIGNEQEFDENCRILVATNMKAGTGFNFPKLDALILAMDLKDFFIQTLGRIFRREDVVPIVFDLVDSNLVLLKHYKDRKDVYLKHGGKIVSYNNKKKLDNDEKEYKHKKLLNRV